MNSRIIRGVRVATEGGIQPASVHIREGRVVAVAGYDEVPRTAIPTELGKGLLMPGLVRSCGPVENWPAAQRAALCGGITTLVADVDLPSTADVLAELSLFLPRQWTAMRNRDQSLEQLLTELCQKPAVAVGLGHRKGHLKEGYDADFVIWRPELTVLGSDPLLYGSLVSVSVT